MADAFDAALAERMTGPVPVSAASSPALRAGRKPAASRSTRRVWAAALVMALLAAGLFAFTLRRPAVMPTSAPVHQAHRLTSAPVHQAHRLTPIRRPARAFATARKPFANTRKPFTAARKPFVRSPIPQAPAAPKTQAALLFRRHGRRRTAAASYPVAALPPARHAPASVPARVQVSVTPSPPPPGLQSVNAPNVLGTWHGSNAHNPATLVITHRQGNAFAGTMNVRTPEANVRIAVTGHVSPKTGAMTMRETQVISATKPRAWDLGQELGHLYHGGKMTGTSKDVKCRFGAWSFSR